MGTLRGRGVVMPSQACVPKACHGAEPSVPWGGEVVALEFLGGHLGGGLPLPQLLRECHTLF